VSLFKLEYQIEKTAQKPTKTISLPYQKDQIKDKEEKSSQDLTLEPKKLPLT
jgi:hypothetical protein